MTNNTTKMQTLKQLWQYQRRYNGNIVGLEVETECSSPNVRVAAIPGFITKSDESLRGASAEFVSSAPTNLNEALNSIDRVIQGIEAYRPNKSSIRTSLHAHYNVQHKTPLEVTTAMFLLWLLEDPLIYYCNKSRWNNIFCRRIRHAEGVLSTFNTTMQEEIMNLDGVPFFYYDPASMKYTTVNVCTVKTFGTVEIRSMDGSLDAERYKTWVQQHSDLIYQNKYDTPSELFDAFWKLKDAREFARQHLNKSLIEQINRNVKEEQWVGEIEENFKRLSHSAYIYNWSKWIKNLSKEAVKKEIIDLRGIDFGIMTQDNLQPVSETINNNRITIVQTADMIEPTQQIGGRRTP